jgi:hypothetical protein
MIMIICVGETSHDLAGSLSHSLGVTPADLGCIYDNDKTAGRGEKVRPSVDNIADIDIGTAILLVLLPQLLMILGSYPWWMHILTLRLATGHEF